MKKAGGIYFINWEKDNMDLLMLANLAYDDTDPVNAGVQNYQLVGCSAEMSIYRVIFKCPISKKTYRFITNISNVSPGLIAYLYKSRWDIEKIFDEVKNKLSEKKAWATSNTAKSMQAEFICLAHNLMLIFEDKLIKDEVDNHVENRRRYNRLKKSLSEAQIQTDTLPIFLKTPKRSTQRSVKFIRWLPIYL